MSQIDAETILICEYLRNLRIPSHSISGAHRTHSM